MASIFSLTSKVVFYYGFIVLIVFVAATSCTTTKGKIYAYDPNITSRIPISVNYLKKNNFVKKNKFDKNQLAVLDTIVSHSVRDLSKLSVHDLNARMCICIKNNGKANLVVDRGSVYCYNGRCYKNNEKLMRWIAALLSNDEKLKYLPSTYTR